MSKVLEVIELEKHYAGFTLDKVSFSIEPGYIMGYIGPNGAGKTTTINAILDIIKPDNGKIMLFGKELTSNACEIKQKIGFVIGENAFYEFLNAQDMAGIISRFYKHWDWGVFNRYMREFELDPGKKIESYSRGMKVKFALACALSHHAELFILDEPTSGLDPVFRSELMEIFQYIISDGEKTILFSTHITSDLDSIADYITFINQGRIVFSRDKNSILTNFALVKGRKDQREKVLGSGKIKGMLESDVGFSALTDDRSWFLRNAPGLVIERATLEDIMVHFIRGNKKNGKLAI
jgi:ABC-2 type transport system ATP-binding protein